ncbi:hypothetical protein [Azospirillum sp.]|uniref:hypothetical protein n=1 Tax=Azospirillum sp. TaxID=34012 RepID=UPI003D72DC3E
MSTDVDAQRGLLMKLRSMVEQYERCSSRGPKLMHGTRYQMAVDATEVNGDQCQFPACRCPKADCAERPGRCPPVDWQGAPRP